MRVLNLSLVVVVMAFVHFAAAKPRFAGGNMEKNGNSKAMLNGNDTQLDMEVPLNENNWVNGDESAVPIANEQQGEAIKFEA
ncbi:Subtilisin-like protease 6 [Colletotrichum sp. SAR 10_77]|nr:Subtilisin-like protease 6 [Colletotrichum sp. SAR 10_77]